MDSKTEKNTEKNTKPAVVSEGMKVRVVDFSMKLNLTPLKETGVVKEVRGIRCLVEHDSHDEPGLRWWKVSEVEKA